ncbi:hypothetical protein BgiMline_033842, partial [Biomphalaria glabrata]
QKKAKDSENKSPLMYDETDETIDYPNEYNPTRKPNDQQKIKYSESKTPSTYDEPEETHAFTNKDNRKKKPI